MQGAKWFKPIFDDESIQASPKKLKKSNCLSDSPIKRQINKSTLANFKAPSNISDKNWMKNFDPVSVEDLAVHGKKIQEVEAWLQVAGGGEMLLISGPVGCGKTATVEVLAYKHSIKVAEWITPIDVDIPMENGQYEFKEKQSIQFQNYIIKSANYASLLDDSASRKLILVEDFPNTFMRTPAEFVNVLKEYKSRGKSPIIFICSETHSDSKNSPLSLFTNAVKEQFEIHHISFNAVSQTGLKSALKRVSTIISKKYSTVYNVPSPEMIDCIVNSSTGDVRSAVLNLHFSSLKGSRTNPDTSILVDKENKSKITKKRKAASKKFQSIGKDEGVSLLHGVGRVLNPKVVEVNGVKQFTHPPVGIAEQFCTQPGSFVSFVQENYLTHFGQLADAVTASDMLSTADCLLSEWKDHGCQTNGLYIAVAGVMVANRHPMPAWNPVRGPKNMRVQYPSPNEVPLLDKNQLYQGPVLALDYKDYCSLIYKGVMNESLAEDIEFDIE